MTGHNWPADLLAGSPEDGINSTDGDFGPFAIPGLPLLPILFANGRLGLEPQLAKFSLLPSPSAPVSSKQK